MITANHKIQFESRRKSKKIISADVDQKPQPQGRLPRITKMMALAIRFDYLIKSGQVTDQAELARVGHVSRARLTQIMNLLYLAPDIQEEILFLSPVTMRNQQTREVELRKIACLPSWGLQRKKWDFGT